MGILWVEGQCMIPVFSPVKAHQCYVFGTGEFRNGLVQHCCLQLLKQMFNLSLTKRGRMFLSFFLYRLCSMWLILAYEDFLVP